MGIILSLQGCMAVGKTTAAQYVAAHAPQIHISYEDVSQVIVKVRERALRKDVFEEYVRIQRLFIANEIERYQRAQQHGVSLMDFGAEEIEFYTLHYPRTIGKDWPVAEALGEELSALRHCMPERILFLRANEETLRARKEGDETRLRTFFDHHLRCLMPLKTRWLEERADVDTLWVDALSREQVGERVLAWVNACVRGNGRELI